MMLKQALNSREPDQLDKWQGRLELLRQRVNDENYLRAAIQRLALVMSNEIMEISSEGGRNERKRRK